MRPAGARCRLIFRRAWPLAPDGDKDGLGALKAAKDSAAKSLTATVSTQWACGKNKISLRFARQLLGADGYELACHSATQDTLGQIAAIVSWTGSSGLWTIYFILDEFLDSDLKLSKSSWIFLGPLRDTLPPPWAMVISRILAELDSSQELTEGEPEEEQTAVLLRHTCHTYREALFDTASLNGSDTSVADSDYSLATSASSIDSARTPTRVASSVNFNVVETGDCVAESGNLPSLPATPCRQTPSRMVVVPESMTADCDPREEYSSAAPETPSGAVASETRRARQWMWDKGRQQLHLPGLSQDDPGVWFDPRRPP